jgi:hypothetical protein
LSKNWKKLQQVFFFKDFQIFLILAAQAAALKAAENRH